MTIAPLPTGVRVRTRPVDELGGLLDLLPDARTPKSWVRGGDGLVGWGEVARWTGSGPDRFADADDWWRSFVSGTRVLDEVGRPGTGPVAFASFTFSDDSPGSVVVVPRVVVGRRDGRAWITEFSRGDGPSVVHAIDPVRPSGTLRYSDGLLPVDRYRAAVAEAVRRMRAGELDKAALAHDLIAVAEAPLDPRHLLGGLAERYPTCWSFAVEGLVGATPELLVRRTGDVVESRVLAGTMWAASPGEGSLGERLMGSTKDRHEHALAVDSLTSALAPLCASLDAPEVPDVLTLHNVSHLASDVRGRLDPVAPASLLRLAEAVHPTAAVGGTPRKVAVDLITELEAMDRGRYAGPVGWIDSRGDGELGIALRCAQLDGRAARLFAGCGIVADSDPDTEVREAAAKLVAVRDALEGD
ncbi:isochorismate synthase [Pseudonocardia sp. KRD-184]|uniref:Isochorismate synthase n=1 Tax=Pseudonocardia oceani TaxID=2792013 RepID=A0ABS6U797_9PSEU|nr:isochorismate synthase [Pseudonocardia oceani]MBW0097728.1 isochorismate synthase [Pseudonocardia oceani]MBW0110246.1 isochorismate synthase [Pseudonocardia oceani]MBW0122904.1 isochorismate synthase [Pseudonocardia oceani]MBW0128110.1 isochorismate synthase [Pseudonocardia oceani]